MRATRALLQNVQLTLFTRANCGLCDTAKHTLAQLKKKKDFAYLELDIMKPGNKEWKDVYEFDVPVLHVQRIISPLAGQEVLMDEARKLFHRFSEEEVGKAIDETKE